MKDFGPFVVREGDGYVVLTLQPNLVSQATYHLSPAAARHMAAQLTAAASTSIATRLQAEIDGETEVVDV